MGIFIVYIFIIINIYLYINIYMKNIPKHALKDHLKKGIVGHFYCKYIYIYMKNIPKHALKDHLKRELLGIFIIYMYINIYIYTYI